ncbi:MAG: hypothetical protein Q9223_005683, partial [Gallowayella weberi]
VNLDLALRRLRLPNQARRLRVDALCIDQSNTDERSRQVRYMRLMYKQAARTIVWLGPKTEGIEEVFRFAHTVADIRAASGGHYAVSKHSKPGTNEVELEIITEIFDAHPEIVNRLIQFFERDYFMRIWCVQEIVVSAWCTAKCDDLETDFLILLSCAIHVNMRRSSLFAERPLEFWNMIYMLKRPGRSGLPRLSGQSIEDSRGFAEFAESVNRIGPDVDFGRNKALKADYNKDATAVYRDLTRFMMRKSPRILEVLSHVQHWDSPLHGTFPSWVPDWSQPRSVSLIGANGYFLAGLCDGHFRYFAVLHDSPLTGPSIQPDTLRIDGYFVDRVVMVSSVMSMGILETPPVESLWHQLFDISFFPLIQRTYRNGELMQMAFCKTLCVGCLGPGAAAAANLSIDSKSDLRARFTQEAHVDAAAYLMQTQTSDISSCTTELEPIRQAASNGSLARFGRSSQIFSHNRRVYMTQNGFLGIEPKLMAEGDEVCVLFGGRVPFVLRRMDNHHILIGESYIHDDMVMWGKLTEGVRYHQKLPTTTFDIR